MASKTEKCSICKRSLGNDSKKELTTSCDHTFHRECVEQRCKEKSYDCPKCDKKYALKNALAKDNEATSKQRGSSASKSNKDNGHTDYAFSAATNKSYSSDVYEKDGNDDEWTCSNCTMDNSASARQCEVCGLPKQSASSVVNSKASSVTDESYGQTTRNPRSHSSHQPYVDQKDDYEEQPLMNRQRWNREESSEWTCDLCEYVNRGSDTVCKICKEPKQSGNNNKHEDRQSNRSLPSLHHAPVSSSLSSKSVPKVYTEFDDDDYSSPYVASDRQPTPKVSSKGTSSESAHGPHAKSKSSKEKTEPSASHSPSMPVEPQVPVYISDLPLDADDDRKLASHIHHRVEKALNIVASDVKCYSKLGVGLMYVFGNKTKDHLLNDIQNLALYPKEGKDSISFVDTLELVSYIVLDTSKQKSNSDLPTAAEISRRWTDLYKGEKPLDCDQLNSLFPNIYRLVSASLEQLVSSLDHQDFKIKNYFARIYFCADCSFLEDLPRSTTYDQLESAIANALKQPDISSSSLHIQLNKQAGNACIIAANTARKWATMSHLYLGDKSISKKQNLTCCLPIRPVPSTLISRDVHRIGQTCPALIPARP